MTCDAVRTLLSAYLDNELDAGELRAVEDHLAACPACMAEFAALRRTVHLVQGLPREAAPADFARRVSSALPAVGATSGRDLQGSEPGAPPTPLRFPRYVFPLAAAASIAIVAGVALLVRQERDAMEGTSTTTSMAARRAAEGEMKAGTENRERRTVAARPAEKRDEGAAHRAKDEKGLAEENSRAGARWDKAPAAPAAAEAPAAFAQAPEKSEANRLAFAQQHALKQGKEGLASPTLPEPLAPAAPPSTPPGQPADAQAADAFLARQESELDTLRRGPPARDRDAPKPSAPLAGGGRVAPESRAPAPVLKAKAYELESSPAAGIARQREAAAPVIELSLHGGDPARQARLLDELAYFESSKEAGGGEARKGLERTREQSVRRAEAQREPITIVYDLSSEDAARFLDRLAARPDLAVTVDRKPYGDEGGAQDAPSRAVLDGVEKLAAGTAGRPPAGAAAGEADEGRPVSTAEGAKGTPALDVAPGASAAAASPDVASVAGKKAVGGRMNRSEAGAPAAASAAPVVPPAPESAPAQALDARRAVSGPADEKSGGDRRPAPSGRNENAPPLLAQRAATGEDKPARRVRVIVRLLPR